MRSDKKLTGDEDKNFSSRVAIRFLLFLSSLRDARFSRRSRIRDSSGVRQRYWKESGETPTIAALSSSDSPSLASDERTQNLPPNGGDPARISASLDVES